MANARFPQRCVEAERQGPSKNKHASVPPVSAGPFRVITCIRLKGQTLGQVGLSGHEGPRDSPDLCCRSLSEAGRCYTWKITLEHLLHINPKPVSSSGGAVSTS